MDQDRETIKNEYDRLIEEGQIMFTTFHQSMSYEDFVEGIKPETTEDDSVIYNVTNGIFKNMAVKAKSLKKTANFETAYNKMINDMLEAGEEFVEMKSVKGKSFWVYPNKYNNLNLFTSENKNHNGVITKEKIEKFSMGENPFVGWEGYAQGIINYLKSNYYLSIENKSNDEKYVLIIDEINRGNVSQIFGELITLIEKDKRLGNDEAVEAILPYSKEKFGVPNNLYIIGTMNTADRSVEALDTALRRRFSFEEMPPRYNLDELQNTVFDIPLSKILQTINLRIEKLLDKDHCIGHAYFLNKDEETLQDAFYRNIIPLLQEYFFGDFGKIGLVLGEGFIKKSDSNSDFADFDHSEYADFAEKDTFEIVDYSNPVTNHSVRKNGIEIPMNFQKAIQLLMKQKIA